MVAGSVVTVNAVMAGVVVVMTVILMAVMAVVAVKILVLRTFLDSVLFPGAAPATAAAGGAQLSSGTSGQRSVVAEHA